MNYHNTTCNAPKLDVLLRGDEETQEFRELAAHVETCAECRDRLTTLAADRDVWEDVSSLLRGYETAEGYSSGDHSASAPDTARDLNFLAPPSHPELLGQLGRYEIEKVIGTGGMGVVLKGYDQELNRPVAIKVLAPHLAHSGAARQRFAREGRAAAAVVHEHVVAIHNVETQAEMPYLVMQYVPGQSLQTRVDQQGPLAAKEILRIGVQAAAGLAAAHAQGVVHRDVKPSNILLENDVERALLTDFGLARAADDATVTRTGVIAGTPHCMATEQASGGSADEKSDLFALGALLYFAATGHPPFSAVKPLAVLNRILHDRHRPVWEINPDIPDGLSDIIDRLLEKKPHKRFANAEEARSALLKQLEQLQQPGAARRRSRFRRTLRQAKPLWTAGAVALVGVAVVAAIFFNALDDQPLDEVSPKPVDPRPTHQEALQEIRRTFVELETADTKPTAAFRAEMEELKREIMQLESAAQAAGLTAPSRDSQWEREIKNLKQRLSEAENTQFDDSFPPGVN